MREFDMEMAAKYNDFTENYELVAVDKGEVVQDWNGTTLYINDSSVKTRLIQAVGKNVKAFASDVLIDLKKVDAFLEERKKVYAESSVRNRTVTLFKFGLRDMGVDGNAEILARMHNGEDYYKAYKAVYDLVITIEPCKYTNNRLDIKMSLFRDKIFYEEVR